MLKYLHGHVDYCGSRARIKCKITDKDGYIAITGEIIPYKCRTPHCFGRIHEYIAKAFPKLKPWLWLHLKNSDGSESWWLENALYHIANGNEEAAQNILRCTDAEMFELSALVRYGLHKEYHAYSKYYSCGKDAQRVFNSYIERMGLQTKIANAYKDFLEFVNTL